MADFVGKKILAARVSKATGVPREDVEKVLDGLAPAVARSLAEGKETRIPGLVRLFPPEPSDPADPGAGGAGGPEIPVSVDPALPALLLSLTVPEAPASETKFKKKGKKGNRIAGAPSGEVPASGSPPETPDGEPMPSSEPPPPSGPEEASANSPEEPGPASAENEPLAPPGGPAQTAPHPDPAGTGRSNSFDDEQTVLGTDEDAAVPAESGPPSEPATQGSPEPQPSEAPPSAPEGDVVEGGEEPPLAAPGSAPDRGEGSANAVPENAPKPTAAPEAGPRETAGASAAAPADRGRPHVVAILDPETVRQARSVLETLEREGVCAVSYCSTTPEASALLMRIPAGILLVGPKVSQREYHGLAAAIKLHPERCNGHILRILPPGANAYSADRMTIVPDEIIDSPLASEPLEKILREELAQAAEEGVEYLRQLAIRLPSREEMAEQVVEVIERISEFTRLGDRKRAEFLPAVREAVGSAIRVGNEGDPARFVDVTCLVDEEKFAVVIKHEGAGGQETGEQTEGSGFREMIMRKGADEVETLPPGNRVMLTKYY